MKFASKVKLLLLIGLSSICISDSAINSLSSGVKQPPKNENKTDKVTNPFIINSTSSSGKQKNGFMTSTGAFISCGADGKVYSNRKWYLHWEQFDIKYKSSTQGPEPTVTVSLKSFVFDTYIEIVPSTAQGGSPALACKSKTENDSTSITFKRFVNGYYIVLKDGKYISFDTEPVYTTDFLTNILIYAPFDLPRRILPFDFFDETYCRDLDCTRVVLKFKTCNQYLAMEAKSSLLPVTFVMQSFSDGYVNLNIGLNYITITPDKNLSFEIQASTIFSLFKVILIKDDELVLMGYGGKFLECKDNKVYLSDTLSVNSKLVPSI